ncbi:MAG TPA: hypothetical protein VK403_07190, partial [Allosphingosinicella sp.]|nr:hypothetical protein [Allosphingosinicella sp.]
GRVFSRAFGTIASNPAATLGIAFLFSTLPSLLWSYAAQYAATDAPAGLDNIALIGIGIFSFVVTILLWMIAQAGLVRATVAFTEGGRASLAESAMAGLQVALPLFLLLLLSVIALVLGFALLIVPGVILYVMWSVAAPALVEERLGPVEALGRSRYLTSGVRWKIFGFTLVMLVLYWLFTAVVGLISLMSYGGLDGFQASQSAGPSSPDLAITGISSTITAALWGVSQSSLYIELRDWKDGPRTEALADIFS